MKDKNKALLVVLVVGLMIGGIIGFGVGSAITLDWVVSKGMYFVKFNEFDIEIDKDEIVRAINMYKSEINLCYP